MDDNNYSVNPLETEEVSGLFIRLAIPTVFAQLVTLIYNIVDRIYIGHIAEYGNLALTSMGICAPIMIMIQAFASLFGGGGAPKASIFLGKKKNRIAQRILGNSFMVMLVVSVVLTIVFRVFSTELLMAFGASEKTLPYALEYMNIYVLGTVFMQISVSLNAFITAQGFNKISMLSVVAGALCNIILDPVFIYGFQMGVKGAALATVISQFVSAICVFMFLIGKKTILRITWQDMINIDRKLLFQCLVLGFSPFIMSITETAIAACFNTSLLKYGGDMAVGAMAICNTAMQLVFIPVQGFGQGAQPIISYNYGADRWDRVTAGFWMLFITNVAVVLGVWIIVMLWPELLVCLFTSDVALIEYAPGMLRIFMSMCFMIGIQSACQRTFLALGNAKASLFLALLRKIFLLIPLIYIMPHFFGDKVFAVFFAEPVADTIATITTFTIFMVYYGKMFKWKRSQ